MSAQGRTTISLLAIDALGASICIALTALLYFGAVHPRSADATMLSGRQAELVEQMNTARQLAASRAAVTRRVEAAQDALLHHDLKLDRTARLNHRLARMSDLAAECGLHVDEIHVGDSTPQTYYQTVALELKCRADFRQAVLFLRSLHRTAPDVGVWSFTLSGNPRDAATAATAEFDLAWFAAPAND
jgi:Tfp pilus assembly protein PilO